MLKTRKWSYCFGVFINICTVIDVLIEIKRSSLILHIKVSSLFVSTMTTPMETTVHICSVALDELY